MDQRLAAFVEVVEQKGFSRAASTLHMTQPAVSQQIRALERDLGARLLERSNRYLHLTAAGEIVYEHARQILELEERMRRYVSDLTQAASGSLAIGASYTIGEYLLPHALAAFRRRHPLVTPTVTIANTQRIAELVVARRLEAGLVEGDVFLPQAQARPLFEDRLTIVAPPEHRLAGSRDIALSELARETWIVREEGSGTRAASDSFFANYALSSVSRLEFGSTQMIKEAVLAGMGVSLLSRWATRREVAQGALVELAAPGTPCVRQFSVLTLRSRFQTRALEVFLRLLDEMAPSLAAE
jgi:DNA-binding transcriptional LysR family regulator